jgi:hypothetical protein
MSSIRIADHAAVRMQQRGIPDWYLQLLIEHGKTTHDGHGAVLKSVSKSTRQGLRNVLSRNQAQLELFLVDPRGTEMFRVAPEAPQLGLYSPLNDVMLIGQSRRPLSTTFAGDDLE